MTRRVRVGVVGPGWVAQDRYLPVLCADPRVDVVALVDRRRERLAEVGDRFGVPGRYTDLARFLDDGLDLVCITTPPTAHPEATLAALAAGCHVVLEKPMAVTAADARAMAEASVDAGRMLCVSHNFLFSRAAARARSALGGAPVRYALASQLSSTDRRLPSWYHELPGGLMLDESPHLLYVLNHFLGGGLTLDHVRARPGDDGHPRLVELLVTGATGEGAVTMVFGSPVSEWHVGLVADRAVVDLDLFRDIAVAIPSDGRHKAGDILATSARALGQHATGFATSGARWARGRLFWGHDELLRRAVDHVLGTGPVPVSLDDALAVVELADQVVAEVT